MGIYSAVGVCVDATDIVIAPRSVLAISFGNANALQIRMTGKLCSRHSIFILICTAALALAAPQVANNEFISYEAAKPSIAAFSATLPQELKTGSLDATKWSTWVQKADHEVRDRLNQGEEDTLTNLLRFGVTFTKEYRIDDEYLVRYGKSSLVDSFAGHRADDLIRALASPDRWPPQLQRELRADARFPREEGILVQQLLPSAPNSSNICFATWPGCGMTFCAIALPQTKQPEPNSSKIEASRSTPISGLISCSTSTSVG